MGAEYAAGPYNLVFGWDGSVDAERFADSTREPIRDAFEFELRDIATAADRLERDYRMAFRAMVYDKEPLRAIPLLNGILAQYPDSAPALLARAHASRDAGLCDSASADIARLAATRRARVAGSVQRAHEEPRDRFSEAIEEFARGRGCAPSTRPR
jgi:hypothetical protein